MSETHQNIMAVTIPLALVVCIVIIALLATECNSQKNECTKTCVSKTTNADALRECLKGCTNQWNQ